VQTRAMFGCPPSLTAAETGRAAARAEAVATARNIDRIGSMALIAALVGALVIEAILIWAIIGLSLGPAGQPGLGPDGPTPPTPQPALDSRPMSLWLS